MEEEDEEKGGDESRMVDGANESSTSTTLNLSLEDIKTIELTYQVNLPTLVKKIRDREKQEEEESKAPLTTPDEKEVEEGKKEGKEESLRDSTMEQVWQLTQFFSVSFL